ncbi:MAG TPA: bifunctional riboflavin kinase/FAD synthetase [Planctomycetaceae bacterium]|nr:bifunctional riboflavin kinase/FAD synthetase [Planctomycetaceae bacterium]
MSTVIPLSFSTSSRPEKSSATEPLRSAVPMAVPDGARRGSVTIGNFDGVHQGHAQLVSQLVTAAKTVRGPAVVVTFDPPPIHLLAQDLEPRLPLTTIQRRAELLGSLGVDYVIVLQTTPELLKLPAKDFFDWLIVSHLDAKAMVEGPNFRFGYQRSGDTQVLKALCSGAEVDLTIAEATRFDEAMISSTRIRQLLNDGDIEAVNELLTDHYQIRGLVSTGERRGRTLGFPTANLAGWRTALPCDGVYCGVVKLDGKHYAAAINIGPNPTFDKSGQKVEVHVVDWDGDLYGSELTVELVDRLRAIKRFESLDALKSQLTIDISRCREIAARH